MTNPWQKVKPTNLYVTEEEQLNERREAAGETPRYINEYLGMSEEEKAAYIAEREAAGTIPTVRLAVNELWHLQMA